MQPHSLLAIAVFCATFLIFKLPYQNEIELLRTQLAYSIGVGIVVGLAVLRAGVGIGRIGGSAVESIARHPEAIGDIRANMILTAALIEGVALFGVVVGLLTLVL